MLLDTLRASMGVEDEIDYPTYLVILNQKLQRQQYDNNEFDVDKLSTRRRKYIGNIATLIPHSSTLMWLQQ